MNYTTLTEGDTWIRITTYSVEWTHVILFGVVVIIGYAYYRARTGG